MQLFFFSECLTWRWTRKFIYSPFENHIGKSAFCSLCIQRQVEEWGVEGKNATQCLLDVSFIRFPSKRIRDTWNRNNAPEGLQNHISIAAMAFKCHARLDTCVIITLRAQPCTFRHKHRSQLCFVGSNALRSQQKSPSVIRKKKSPLEGSAVTAHHLQCKAPTRTFSLLCPLYLFLLANDSKRDGSCGVKPQLSGRGSHRWARPSQLNPQAAGSDDAQDASYQQDVL